MPSGDVVALKLEDIAPSGYALDRATVRQSKTGRPVRFELGEATRQAVDDYLRAAPKTSGDFLFPGRQLRCSMTNEAVRSIGSRVDRQHQVGPPPIRDPLASKDEGTLIYRRTGNLRAMQLLLGHTKIESTVRYLGIEVDDALAIAEQVEV